MPNYNHVALMGNLCRDPETRHTQGGVAICKFSMAVNRKSKDRETTCYVDCTAFGKSGELIQQYVQKGSPLFVDGRLEYSQWEDNDGRKRNKLEVVVENFQFMPSGEDRGEQQGRRSGGGRQQHEQSDEVPF